MALPYNDLIRYGFGPERRFVEPFQWTNLRMPLATPSPFIKDEQEPSKPEIPRALLPAFGGAYDSILGLSVPPGPVQPAQPPSPTTTAPPSATPAAPPSLPSYGLPSLPSAPAAPPSADLPANPVAAPTAAAPTTAYSDYVPPDPITGEPGRMVGAPGTFNVTNDLLGISISPNRNQSRLTGLLAEVLADEATAGKAGKALGQNINPSVVSQAVQGLLGGLIGSPTSDKVQTSLEALTNMTPETRAQIAQSVRDMVNTTNVNPADVKNMYSNLGPMLSEMVAGLMSQTPENFAVPDEEGKNTASVQDKQAVAGALGIGRGALGTAIGNLNDAVNEGLAGTVGTEATTDENAPAPEVGPSAAAAAAAAAAPSQSAMEAFSQAQDMASRGIPGTVSGLNSQGTVSSYSSAPGKGVGSAVNTSGFGVTHSVTTPDEISVQPDETPASNPAAVAAALNTLSDLIDVPEPEEGTPAPAPDTTATGISPGMTLQDISDVVGMTPASLSDLIGLISEPGPAGAATMGYQDLQDMADYAHNPHPDVSSLDRANQRSMRGQNNNPDPTPDVDTGSDDDGNSDGNSNGGSAGTDAPGGMGPGDNKREGGMVYGKARPVNLHPPEMVFRKEAVKFWGPDLLEFLNEYPMQFMKKEAS